jgi:hypothetical protein
LACCDITAAAAAAMISRAHITNAPRSSGKELAELHDALETCNISAAAAAAAATIQITSAMRSSGKELAELPDVVASLLLLLQ